MLDDDFVTVAEASRRLGISERQARRYAGQLPDSDRTMPDKGAARYRFSSLSKAAGKSETPDSAGHNDRTMPDNAGQGPDTSGAALIDQLRGEVEYLRAALTREQETARMLTSELSEARKQSAVLIAATAIGRINGYSPTAGERPVESPETNEGGETGESIAPPTEAAQEAEEAEFAKVRNKKGEGEDSRAGEFGQVRTKKEEAGEAGAAGDFKEVQSKKGLWERIRGWVKDN